jgi:hypothetical protein
MLRVIRASGTYTESALVDAGSDDTLLPLSIGRMVGATIDPLQTWLIEGVGGGTLTAILGEVMLELADGSQTFRWQTKVGFVDFPNPVDRICLLGHAGFLEFFRTTYDGYLHVLEVEVTPAFPGTIS